MIETDQPKDLTPIQRKIYELLQECPHAITRGQICELCDLKWTTAFDNLRKLEKRKLVKRYSKRVNNGRGAPYKFWELNHQKVDAFQEVDHFQEVVPEPPTQKVEINHKKTPKKLHEKYMNEP